MHHRMKAIIANRITHKAIIMGAAHVECSDEYW